MQTGKDKRMNIADSWEAQTKELIDRIEQEIREAKDEHDKHMASLLDRRWALMEALEAYKEMMGTKQSQAVSTLNSEDTSGKSYKDILRLIAERNGGLLVARIAISLMKDANVFGNPQNADGMVYSILGRSREFVKVGRGVYKLNGTQKKAKTNIRKGKILGLKQAVVELKEGNPNITKAEVRDTLIRKGFDFQGRNPNRSIHMLWVNLGYAKKEVQ